MTEFLARLGDRINPIVVKETRQAVNSRLVAAFLLIFLGVQLLVMLLTITGREVSGSDVDLRAGREMFTIVQGILLGACMVLIPTMTGARLASERSDVNVDLLFISSLTPRAVLLGKLIAAAALALLIFSACAPFMTFAYVMRGLDMPTILIVLTGDYLAVLLGTTWALFLASVPANRGLRILLGLGGFFFICYLGGGLLVASAAFLRGGSDFDLGTWEFWLACLGVIGLTFGSIGLLFVWSVALISPPAANRAFQVRVYTLLLWALGFVGFAIWSLLIGRPEPVGIWGMLGCAAFSLQMVVAVCERDHWGGRVARRIPRNVALRVPAFIFYSGAAGGIAFGVIGAALSAVGIAFWYLILPSTRYSREEEYALIAVLVAAYTYCYSLTAAVIRRALDGKSAFRPGYTWVIALILFGLGCTLPFIFRFAFSDPYSRYGHDELMPLYVTNPAVMIPDAVRLSDNHVVFTIIFLMLWGGVITMANAQWFVKQAMNFRPPDSEPEFEVVERE